MGDISDGSIHLAIDLIRSAGRKPQYVDFLSVLCECNGRSVRTNQSRVAQHLLVDAPELLLSLRLKDGVVCISGDPTYFVRPP